MSSRTLLLPKHLEQTGEDLPFDELPERFEMWKVPGWENAVARLIRGLVKNDHYDYGDGGRWMMTRIFKKLIKLLYARQQLGSPPAAEFGDSMKDVFTALLVDGPRCANRLSHTVFGGVGFTDITEEMRPGYPTYIVSRLYQPAIRAAYRYLIEWGLENSIVIERGDGGGPGYPMGDSGADLHEIATELGARVPPKTNIDGNDALDFRRVSLHNDFDVILYQVLALLPNEPPNLNANRSLIVRGQTSIHDRYAVLIGPASMALVLPGGYGTGDEATDMDILNQFCGKAYQKTLGPRLQIQLDCEVPYAEAWGLPAGITYFEAMDLQRRIQISSSLSRENDELRVRFRLDQDDPKEVGIRIAKRMIQWHEMTKEFRAHEVRVLANAIQLA